ncbi:LCP family protein [Paenibacillus crassostreae]|uniref:Transcriptional regulator n=1 Tax=Paenibacillus crassostreae TaxID=1763538 RepID=A0A167BFQ4_9BACL|nr:LCP family protein [Paenibacillus crassostreae]AOZ92879.1 transcriptional regulator [Paenibacillus crassostreae]OAB72031.1 transcriptional regulator [Paenibacillus crassostreae]
MKTKTKSFTIVAIVLVLILAGGYIFRKSLAVLAFDIFLADQVENTLQEKSYKPLEEDIATRTPKAEPIAVQSKPFSILLLGTDQREDEPARSDTMIYAVMRPKESKVLLVSIPRDTYTEIVGKGKKDKINHAFAFGGEQMAVDTMEKLLDHSLDYYATINFVGLKDAVDAIGGIELPIQKDIVNKGADHEKFTVKANQLTYNGTDALNYVRYREDSDFNRTKRQQVFLDQVAKKMMNVNQVSNIPQLLDIMGTNFQTNMQPKFILDLAKQILTGSEVQITSYTVMGENIRLDGISYEEADEEDLQFAQDLIDNWMNSTTSTYQLLMPDDQNTTMKDTSVSSPIE